MAIKIILLLALLCGAAIGQPLPVAPQAESLQVALEMQLNLPHGGAGAATQAAMRTALNRSAVEVCRDFPAYELSCSLSVARSVEGAELPRNCIIATEVFRIIGDTIRVPLERLSYDSLSIVLNTLDKNVQDKANKMAPRYWYQYGKSIFLVPKYLNARSNDQLLVHYRAFPNKLVADNDSTVINPEFFEPMLNYAASILSRARNNWEDADKYMDLYKLAKGGQ